MEVFLAVHACFHLPMTTLILPAVARLCVRLSVCLTPACLQCIHTQLTALSQHLDDMERHLDSIENVAHPYNPHPPHKQPSNNVGSSHFLEEAVDLDIIENEIAMVRCRVNPSTSALGWDMGLIGMYSAQRISMG